MVVLIFSNIFFSDKDLYLNMDQFKREKGKNILFVTGVSGSGKSTLADKLAKVYKAESIELDGFDSGPMKHDHPFIHEYFELHPELKKEEYLQYEAFEKAFTYLVGHCNRFPTRLFVINGIQIYEDLGNRKDWFYDKPLVIKGTSLTSSLFRKVQRNDYAGRKLDFILNNVEHTITSHINYNEFKDDIKDVNKR